MSSSSLSSIALGVVPTHAGFSGALVPQAGGRYFRDEQGRLVLLEKIRELIERTPVAFGHVQISYFCGTDAEDLDELFRGLNALGLEIHIIMMVGGANPMNPADEDRVLAMLSEGLEIAKQYGIRHVSSTSIEEWMSAAETRREGDAFAAAVLQNVKLHERAYREAGLANSCVEDWHIEFLRPVEFKTFTDLERTCHLITEMNRAVGRPFFKVLVDAAHCGDSGLTIPENEKWIAAIARNDALGIFHASAKTTRGCLLSDEGWIGAMLAACWKTGRLKYAFVEIFDHADEGLEKLRQAVPGHGVDTRDGRDYTQLVVDGLKDVSRRLHHLRMCELSR